MDTPTCCNCRREMKLSSTYTDKTTDWVCLECSTTTTIRKYMYLSKEIKINEVTVLETSIKLLESTLTDMPSRLADDIVKQVITLLKMLENLQDEENNKSNN